MRFLSIFFLLVASVLVAASVVQITSPNPYSFNSTESNELAQLGSFTAGQPMTILISRDASDGKQWDRAVVVAAFIPSSWTVSNQTQDNKLVVTYYSAPESTGAYVLKIILEDTDSGLTPQTIALKVNILPLPLAQIVALRAQPEKQQTPQSDVLPLVAAILIVVVIAVLAFYFGVPAYRKARAKEMSKTKIMDKTQSALEKTNQFIPVSNQKRIIVIEDEKPAEKEQEKGFQLRSSSTEKQDDINVPVKKTAPATKASADAKEAPAKEEAMKSLSLEELFEPKTSTKQVIDDIDYALKELKPKYSGKKPIKKNGSEQ